MSIDCADEAAPVRPLAAAGGGTNASQDVPELTVLLHLLIDELCDVTTKAAAVQLYIESLLRSGRAVFRAYHDTYYDLLMGATTACSAVVSTPTTLGGSEGYSCLLRSALCGLIPSIIERLEKVRLDTYSEHLTNDDPADGNPNSSTTIVDAVVGRLFEQALGLLSNCEATLDENVGRRATGRDGEEYAETAVKLPVEGDMLDALDDEQRDSANGRDHGLVPRQDQRKPLRAELLHSLSSKGILSAEKRDELLTLCRVNKTGDGVDGLHLGHSSTGSRSVSEARQAGVTLEVFFEQKLASGAAEDLPFLKTLTDDYAAQDSFSLALTRAFQTWSVKSELDSIARTCTAIMDAGLDILRIWLMFASPSSVLIPLSALLGNATEHLQSGEEPASLAAIALFAQLVLQQSVTAGLTLDQILPREHQGNFSWIVRSASIVRPLDRFPAAEQELISGWIISLFGSEGISDDLIRSSSPQLLLSITPTLFWQIVSATNAGLLDDPETLRGGLTYFLQDLLSYTLPGAIHSLLHDIERCHIVESQLHDEKIDHQLKREKDDALRRKKSCLEILCFLLRSESCPKAVTILVADHCVSILSKCEHLSEDAAKLLADLTQIVRRGQLIRRSDLWIKVTQASLSRKPSLSSLNISDALLFSILVQKGTDAVIRTIQNSFSLHATSQDEEGVLALQCATSFSLALMTMRTSFFVDSSAAAHRQDGPSTKGLSTIDAVQIADALLISERPTTAAASSMVETIKQVASHVSAIDSPAIRRLRALYASASTTSGTGDLDEHSSLPPHITAVSIAEALRSLIEWQTSL